MRFGQFDRVTISMDKPHIRIEGEVAWAVGMEKVDLLRKDGKTISFDAFVTNVFGNKRRAMAFGGTSGNAAFQAARVITTSVLS